MTLYRFDRNQAARNKFDAHQFSRDSEIGPIDHDRDQFDRDEARSGGGRTRRDTHNDLLNEAGAKVFDLRQKIHMDAETQRKRIYFHGGFSIIYI